jgi:hypothetical protein
MARVGKIKVPVEICSCERDRLQALNALLSEQLEEARQWHLAAVRGKRAAQADAERLFTALDGYIMARITGTDLRDYDDLAERAARAHRSLAGVSAEAAPERGGVGAIDDGPVGQERSGESAVAPPQNPYARQPYRGAGRPEAVAWNEGYAAGVAAGRSIPSTGTGWDRGYAAGLAARDTPEGER